MHQFFGGCLTIAAGDGYKGYVELLPVETRKLLQCGKHIFYAVDLIGGIIYILIHYGKCGAGFERLPGESITVEIGAFQRKEDITSLQFTRVCLYRRILPVNGVELFYTHAANVHLLIGIHPGANKKRSLYELDYLDYCRFV